MGLHRLLEAGRATLPFRIALLSRRLDPSTGLKRWISAAEALQGHRHD
jgi:hypothetical protein